MSDCLTNEATENIVLASSNSQFESTDKKTPTNQYSSANNSSNGSVFSTSSSKLVSQGPSILRHRKSSSISKKINKRVNFNFVDLYHFDRVQGFTCVPSQGGSTLGMTSEHWAKENISVFEHQKRRRNQRNAALLRFCMEGKLLLSLKQFRILKRRVKSASSIQEVIDNISTFDECVHESNKHNLEKCAGSLEKVQFDKPTGFDNGNGSMKRSSEVSSFRLESPECIYPDESDEDLHFLDSLEEYYFLQPLPVKKRRILLRRAGIQRIDASEKVDCQAVRISRTECGCNCPLGICDPATCQCTLNGISCQVDRSSFPCTCVSPIHCQNPGGRIEFNPVRVKAHYLHTRMRLELELQRETGENSLLSHKRAKMMSNNECCSSRSPISSNKGDSEETCQLEEASEALLAAMNTTLQGGCRECLNDRYVRVNHELTTNGQKQAEDTAATKDAFMLHGTLAFEQSGDAIASSSVVDSGRSSAGSLDDYAEQQQETGNSQQCLLDEASDEAFSPELDDDDDDEEEEEEDDETVCCEDLQQAAVVESSLGHQQAVVMATPSSGLTSLHLFRLEPISSLFHNNTAYHPPSPHQSNNSSPIYLQTGSESPAATTTAGSPSRPTSAASPSLCEVGSS